MPQRAFASDNYAPVHPEVWAAMREADAGHATSYGADPWTAHAEELFRDHLGPTAEAFVVLNGTGANVVALQALLRPWEAVVCAATAHINVDEGGAPERLLGSKLIDVATPDGKLTPELIRSAVVRVGDEHAVQPRVVSVTQSTELGTRYELHELAGLAETAHTLGLLLHLDGARIANAAVSLGVGLRETTTDVGVDVMSFGGTKNGAMGAEAVVFLTPGLTGALPWIRKSSMQLASKHRYLSAQFVALLEGDLWRRNAEHANAMAARLAAAVDGAPGVRITQPVQANAVFAELPAACIPGLQAEFPFYVWDESRHEVRWMCSWDTLPDDVDAFAALVRATVGAN